MFSRLGDWLFGRRAEPEPARIEADWSGVVSYTELCSVAADHGWLSPDRFLAGPFQRYLDLCGDGETHPRVRARIMEFGVWSLDHFAEQQRAATGADPAAFVARAHAVAADWFADKPDGDYMLEVLTGAATHNHRAPEAAPDPEQA